MSIPFDYTWRIIYQDDTALDQFEPVTHVNHKFAEIQQDKVREVQVLNRQGSPVLCFALPKKSELVMFHRHYHTKFPDGKETDTTYYYFGWKEKVYGKSVEHLNYITPTGVIVLTNKA